MIRTALALAASLAANQAAALSCIPPDVARTFTEAAKSEDTYMILLGRFDVPPGALPELDLSDNDPEPVSVQAMFRGQQLQADGSFDGALSVPVLLAQSCAGPWCGQMAQDQRMLAFVRQTETGLVLDVEPCDQWHFARPTDEMLETLGACVTGGECAPAEF